MLAGAQGGFCGKVPAASPVPDGADASRLPDGPAAGHGRARQRRWQRLWDNGFQKGESSCARAAAGGEGREPVGEQQPCSPPGQGRRGPGGLQAPEPVGKPPARQAVPPAPGGNGEQTPTRSPWDPRPGQGQRVRGRSGSDSVCGTDPSPIPRPPAPLRGGGRDIGSEAEPGEGGGEGGSCS